MSKSLSYRYPGVKPFSSEERQIFFGREAEIDGLNRFILQNRLVVLYAKSGMGKSSLLNAGIIPRLQESSDYHPLSIRLGAFQSGRKEDLLTLVKGYLPLPDAACYLDRLLPEDQSLWRHFKRYQALVPTQSDFVLLFDQFEELFTYPEASIESLHHALGELLNSDIPQAYRDAIEKQEPILSPEEIQLLYRPLNLRVVFSIRSDRLSELDRLSAKLPDILDKRYHLKALDQRQAQDAILDPAYLAKEDYGFRSPPFDYEDAALEQLLNFLNQGGRIESFQLQVICQYAESKILQEGLSVIKSNDLGDLSKIFAKHYERQIAQLGDETEQALARRMIEEGLIFEEAERRISLYEGIILQEYGLSKTLLKKLVDTHLLRAEPDQRGGFVYELSHDTLVLPVLAAKKERQAQEEKAEQAQLLAQEKQKLQEERKKRQQARLIAAGGIGLALIAMIALIFAISLNQVAKEAQAEAQARLHVSQANLIFAEGRNTYLALSQLDTSAVLFPDKEEAVLAYLKVIEAQPLEEEMKIFYLRHAFQMGVAQDMLAVTSLALFKDYWGKPSTYGMAAEMAELYAATGDSVIDWQPYIDTVRAFGAYEAAMRFLRADSLQGLAIDSVQAMATALLEEIGDRPWYYTKRRLTALSGQAIEAGGSYPLPEMVLVKGDTFWMGSLNGGSDESPLHQVVLSDYEIARYELSVGHYVAFLNAQKLATDSIARWVDLGEQIQFIEDKYQSINGQEGFPIMRVSWYGAKAYTDWLRDSLGQAWELPTEAQWEFAAAGGSNAYTAEGKRRFRYAGSDTLENFAWYDRNSQRTWHPVGMLKENSLGIYDMSGNMWEWCGDWYASDYYELCQAKGIVENPIGPEDKRNYRVLRGGSWYSDDYFLRVANRFRGIPDFQVNFIGFRPARTLP